MSAVSVGESVAIARRRAHHRDALAQARHLRLTGHWRTADGSPYPSAHPRADHALCLDIAARFRRLITHP